MNNIKIVDYEHKYAAATAVMWQNSSKGWNGDSFFTTEQAVITDEENSLHLNAWLAMEGEAVVGYCNLYEYQEDTGALYIGLLNVRDDYHGRKIGKVLVLKAVEETIQLGWDRLDLYTWSGNTKAVPLYKKTGFFWEDRDDTTHLMNFIPSVLKNELLTEHFNELDWYADSIRPIEVKPDGRKENEFDYLTYEWQKGKKHVLAEFCRRGRGLRKIETNEYSVTATVEDLKLVFGDTYKIKYEIKNKTNEPLNIKINGISEKNIKFDFAKEISVKDGESLEANFFVGVVETEQSIWKTHPNVISEISVNGKRALFKIGVDPKFPAKINLNKESVLCYLDSETEMFIDIVNCCKEDAVFSFKLPETENISFSETKFEIAMKPEEKKSVPVKYILKKAFGYKQEVEVKVKKQNSEFTFKRNLYSIFADYAEMFRGKIENYDYIANGKYVLFIRNKDFINQCHLVDLSGSSMPIHFQYPKIGKPYTNEFNKRIFDKLEHSFIGSVASFRVHYSSEEIKGLKFVNCFELNSVGILKNWLEFEYAGKQRLDKDVILKYNVGIPFTNSVMHYNGNLVETKGDVENGSKNWTGSNFTEPWIFGERKNTTVGFAWDKNISPTLGDWERFFEFNIGKMKSGEKVVLKPIIGFLNTFRNYKEFRDYAMKQITKSERKEESLQFQINSGNPFVNKSLQLSVQEFKDIKRTGSISISSQKRSFKAVSGKLEDSKNLFLETEIITNHGIDIAEINAELEFLKFNRKKVIFPISKGEVKHSVNEDEQIVTNGVLTLKVSDKFGPVLHSMKFHENEWLDSSYPEPSAKSWWKPWLGGIYFIPQNITEKSILKEDYKVEFVKKQDTLGNVWSGLCVSYEFMESEKYKGLKVKQYFLLLPGTPIMFYTAEIFQNTGKYLSGSFTETACFLKPSEDLKDSSFLRKSKDCNDLEVFAGDKSMNRRTQESAIFRSKEREEILQIKSTSKYKDIYMDADNLQLSAWIGDQIKAKNGETVYMNSHFYIFSNEIIENELLEDLHNIKFK